MNSSTSGDLLADRRFGLAQTFAAEGDHRGAADLLEQTLELVPAWAPAWLALGTARERMNEPALSIAAFRRACELDQDGRFGAVLYLARAQGAEAPEMPAAFVRALFDQYADRFDEHLVGDLGYQGPTLIAAGLHRIGATDLGAVLDLGCGTGLMARALASQAAAIDGVDLAPRMVRQAEATGLYRRLAVGEAVAFLKMSGTGTFDAVLAADVLVYLGDLAPVMAEAFRVLPPGGVFAFTVQSGTKRDYVIGADMRFHHAEAYVIRKLEAAGFRPALVEHASTRLDRGVPVPGLVAVAWRP